MKHPLGDIGDIEDIGESEGKGEKTYTGRITYLEGGNIDFSIIF